MAQWAQATLLPVFRLSGAKVSVEHSPEIDTDGAYLIVSNHQSMIDIPLIGGTLRGAFPKFVAKRELSKGIPTVSYNLRAGGHLIIDRAKGSEAVRRLRDFGRRAQEEGFSPVLFPEGSRSRDGRLKEFKEAGFVTLVKSAPDLPVVPVAIDGSWKLLINKFFPIPFGVHLRIRFLDPIERVAGEDPSELLARVRGGIETTLEAWHSEPSTA
ncbi:MAG: 1-acyl-sn-glycerol-3-phosphate acyltransferase [Acidimicrobiia bacterium]|nr:1-acyl-sn-glycerol-3-phosphate acyltransferase [Acidimicrobiia bacterium]